MTIENLKSSEYDLFSFFEMTPDFVCIANREGYFKNVNSSVIKKLGYSMEELFSRPIASFIHPDDQEATHSTRQRLLEGTTLLNFQNRYVAKTGKVIWLEWTSIYLSDKQVVFAIAKDISTRKEAELEVAEEYKKFKHLASHFKSTAEEDRKYLAEELHEQLAQIASAVRVDLDWLNTNVKSSNKSQNARIEHAIIMSDLLVDTIRRISFAISPSMLDDLGLNATLEWYCREFSGRNQIACRFAADYKESSLSREVQLDFFRICQECLANVQQHAEASEVDIRIHERNGRIVLSITDNGRGFDLENSVKNSGLLSMRERVISVNGKYSVDSEPGIGTTIYVEVGAYGNESPVPVSF